MKIAFTAKGQDWDSQIDPRFGRTDFIFIYDQKKDETEVHDNREIANVAHGAGPQTAQKFADLNPDILITGNGPGGNAARALKPIDMEIYAGANGMTLKQAYQAYKDDKLNKV
jgi:predicted Fe-Mo cluster-binding NifX family protein